MHRNFSEPELVELGCMIGLTLGQQSWLRLLNIDHHQVLAGTDASMAPGYEDLRKAQGDQVVTRLLGEDTRPSRTRSRSCLATRT